ncbi:FMN1 [Sanghuangporus weigelae]
MNSLARFILAFSLAVLAFIVNWYIDKGTFSTTMTVTTSDLFNKPPSTSTALMEESTPLSTEDYRATRLEIVGPDDGPEQPFPLALHGAVQKGFGRGGKELGCPTANLPDEALRPLSAVMHTGIYFGFAQVLPRKGSEHTLGEEDGKVHAMVMSLGWNPFYKNERLSAEVHIMHVFKHDFYGNDMRVLLLGYIRPELDYTSREALIDDIETDKQVAIRSLARPAYVKYANDSLFLTPPGETNHRLNHAS